jgi:hypothetical protein
VADGHVAFRFLIDDERQIVLLQRLERRLIEQAEREGLALPTRH